MVPAEVIAEARRIPVLSLVPGAERMTRASAAWDEWAGACPLCGGRDRFHVQVGANRWFCRRCTGDPQTGGWQDAISLAMRLKGLSFGQAVRHLAAMAHKTEAAGSPDRCREPVCGLPDPGPSGRAVPGLAGAGLPASGLAAADWQAVGLRVVEQAAAWLWGRPGRTAIAWLGRDPQTGQTFTRQLSPLDWLGQRGLSSQTIRSARLGFLPPGFWHAGLGLGGPAVLIPGFCAGGLAYIKLRRPVYGNGQPRYTQARGSHPALYGAAPNSPDLVCVTEGELDCLLLGQALAESAQPALRGAAVVTPGSSAVYPNLAEWGRCLYAARLILLFYDQDGKSEAAIRRWQSLTPRAQAVRWAALRPGDKDLTDYACSGGSLAALAGQAILAARPQSG